jgi:hypothetical protein
MAEHILSIHPILPEICNQISMFRISHQFNLPSSKYPKTLILFTLVVSLTLLAMTWLKNWGRKRYAMWYIPQWNQHCWQGYQLCTAMLPLLQCSMFMSCCCSHVKMLYKDRHTTTHPHVLQLWSAILKDHFESLYPEQSCIWQSLSPNHRP